MSKFNGFEKYLLVQGLERVSLEMKADIRDLEERGKNPLMTIGYVEMVVRDTLDKLTSFTLKEKQMSDIYNTWKGKEKKVSKTFSPMIGMIYQSNNYIGALVAIEDDVATLQLKNKSLIKVQVQTLKIKIDE